MEKAIAHTTDTRLYERARLRLVGLARKAGIDLRQSPQKRCSTACRSGSACRSRRCAKLRYETVFARMVEEIDRMLDADQDLRTTWEQRKRVAVRKPVVHRTPSFGRNARPAGSASVRPSPSQMTSTDITITQGALSVRG